MLSNIGMLGMNIGLNDPNEWFWESESLPVRDVIHFSGAKLTQGVR
jgi:hypothetical protein